MPYARPTLAELRARIAADYSARLGIGPLLPRSVLLGLSQSDAGQSHGQHGHIAYVAEQIFPDTADAEHLERIASSYGITRRPATPAIGLVEFTGSAGTAIPLGTILSRTDGVQFATTVATAIEGGGTVEVEVEATSEGATTNTEPATVLELVSPIVGVDGEATVASGGLGQGADRETDDRLRDRLLDERRNPPVCGSLAAYRQAALSVPGVTRAWAIDNHMGLGTVGIAVVEDDSPTGPTPSSATLAAVEAAVEEIRQVGTTAIYVFGPGLQALDPEIQLEPNTAAVQSSVADSIEALLLAETAPGAELLRSHVSEAISLAAGEVDHVLDVPAANVTPPAGTILVLGTPVFSSL